MAGIAQLSVSRTEDSKSYPYIGGKNIFNIFFIDDNGFRLYIVHCYHFYN